MVKRHAPEAAVKYAAFLRKTKPGIKKIYLFGSHAKGNIHQDSDIDIAVVFHDLSDSFDMQVELMKLRRSFDTRIEPHPFSAAEFNKSNPLAFEILKNGFEITA
jgi:predicted nucleotidyltransferase